MYKFTGSYVVDCWLYKYGVIWIDHTSDCTWPDEEEYCVSDVICCDIDRYMFFNICYKTKVDYY